MESVTLSSKYTEPIDIALSIKVNKPITMNLPKKIDLKIKNVGVL
jgi:hypothetical protein